MSVVLVEILDQFLHALDDAVDDLNVLHVNIGPGLVRMSVRVDAEQMEEEDDFLLLQLLAESAAAKKFLELLFDPEVQLVRPIVAELFFRRVVTLHVEMLVSLAAFEHRNDVRTAEAEGEMTAIENRIEFD